MRNLLLSSTIVAVAALAATACSNPEPTADAAAPVERRVDVPAITVGTADLESTLEISGSLMPQARVAVMPKLPGMLSTISVDLGDRVRAGQVVATLDRREIDAQVDAAAAAVGVARAGIESAEAALANAVLEHDRARNLFEKGAIARQRLDAAETARRASSAQRDLANANLNQVEAALRRARELQRDATITSPIEGVVVERNFDAGSLVGPGDKPIVIVADLRIMTLEAGVSELEAGRLRAGMPARVTAQAKPGEVYEGRLAAVAPEVDARNRHFAIEVRTPNPGGALLSGMYATATIPIERAAQAVAVPREAVTSRDGARVVLKIDNNTVQAVPVTEGLISGGLVQITSGLRAGDVIVSDARREVAGGVTVNPVFAK
jgi:RND family efflux transporter MFP subunit